MNTLPEPCEANEFLANHLSILDSSLKRWTGRALLDPKLNNREAAKSAYLGDFALLSHDTTEDPVFNYANCFAQRLFEMNWREITALPSRRSAEAVDQSERKRLLKIVADQGYIDDYQGVRISSSQRRFLISKATVWNLYDQRGDYYGQAALFRDIRFLD